LSFSLTTYNVLADSYIRPDWFPNTPPEWLDPARRHPALVDSIAELGTELIALQEVELDVFRRLEVRLETLGYRGMYGAKGRNKPDGCATFVKVDLFSEVEWQRLHYDDATEDGPASGHLALIARLEVAGRSVSLANTHVKWAPPETPRAEHQGARQLDELVAWCLAHPSDAWIVCGDLNCPPESAVLDGLRGAGLTDTHTGIDTPTCNANRLPRKLDHIFASQGLEACPGVIPSIQPDTALPSSSHPSDHLPVTAGLTWR